MFKHKTEPLASPWFRNPALRAAPPRCWSRCLAKAPGDRFADFHELARHLEPRAAADSPWETYQDETLERFFEAFRPRKASYLDPRIGADVYDRYPFPGGRTLTILRGDITRQEVDAVVSSDDEFLTMGGGVSLAIRRNGGPSIRQEAQRYAPVRPGRAVVTSAGSLPARFVFHGVTLSFENWGMIVPSRDLIAEIVASCFYQADTLNLKSIALPLLGTGTGGFSREVCLDTIVRSIARALLHGTTCVEDARVVIYP
ncbi:MAG: macro domain-containing protein [Isosphaeraceae bacterium]